MENQELLQELEKRVKQGKIILSWSVIGCYNCDAEGAIGLTVKNYQIDFAELAEEVEKIKKEQKGKKDPTKKRTFERF